VTPAVARVHEKVADMQKIADDEKARHQDRSRGTTALRREGTQGEVDLDETQITPYMQLENLREGMFYMARELFGFHFKPVDATKVPVYHPDVPYGRSQPEGRARRDSGISIRTRARASVGA